MNTLEAGPAIAYSLFPRIEGLRVEAGALFTWASLDSTPNEGGLGASISDWTVTAHAGARGWVDTWRIRWTLGAGALLPFRAVTAADAGRAVTSIKGLGVEVTAGGLVRF